MLTFKINKEKTHNTVFGGLITMNLYAFVLYTFI